MISKLIEAFRKIPKGTLQTRLQGQENALTEAMGKAMVARAHDLGDHAAGLVTVFASKEVGLINSIEKSMPSFGHATPVVRGGGLVYDAEKGIEALPRSGTFVTTKK